MKVLQIAYYYPPMGGAGVQRALKFSKYLGEFGITPVVLAALDPSYVSDPSLADEVPAGVTIYRVDHRPLLQRLMALRSRPAPSVSAVSTARSAAPAQPSPMRTWLRDAVLSTYASLRFPDDKSDWARNALREARTLVKVHGIQLIFSSAPPVSGHWIAARLARETGLPWVADYRDLWTENPAYAAPDWRRAIDLRSESAWLRHAAGVVTVTPSWRDGFARRLGTACPVAFIPNGYDEADFAAIRPLPHELGICRVVHAGTFYGHQSPLPLLAAAQNLLAHEPALAQRLRLRFVGLVGARFDAALDAFSTRFPGVLERTGFVEHRRAVAEMLAADLLLLVIGGGASAKGVLPGKVFEYLGTGRPVLLIGPADGDAAQLLRAHGRCRIAEEGDVAGISGALAAALSGTLWPPLPVDAAPQAYERRALTQQLAEFLFECAEASCG